MISEQTTHEEDLHGYSVWSDSHSVYVSRQGGTLCKASFTGADRYHLARQWIAEN